jgi:hypothetical protein
MITSNSINVTYIQSWEDDNETSQLYGPEASIAGEVGYNMDADVAGIEPVLVDEESDFEEDYTGGWLCVER